MRVLAILLALMPALLMTGCAGYRLGPTDGQPAGRRSIQVLPISNQTLEPRVSDALTSALRKEIQRDGTFTLVTGSAADVVVSGAVTQFGRSEISFLPGDVITAQDYQVGFSARMLARERETGEVILEREFSGSTLMRVGTDLPSVERQSLPLIAADLARQIVAALADGSW